jgi:osmotically-inducible protein OsmY
MKGFGRISAAIGASLAGVGAAVFLHPRQGARNRHAAAGVARRRSVNVATLVGTAVPTLPGRTARREEQLAQSVRDALSARHLGIDAGLHISAHKSTVTLRGEVDQLSDIDALEATARSVAGVSDINNLLRLAAPLPSRR